MGHERVTEKRDEKERIELTWVGFSAVPAIIMGQQPMREGGLHNEASRNDRGKDDGYRIQLGSRETVREDVGPGGVDSR